MAVFNEILVGRLNRALQKWSGIKGASPSRQLASEIMPTVNLPVGVEFRYLENWVKFGLGFSIAGSAGQTNGVRFRNPPASGAVAVFECIQVIGLGTTTANTQFNLEGWVNTTLDLNTLLSNFNTAFDSRTKVIGGAIVVTSQNNNVAILGSAVALGVAGAGQVINFIPTVNCEMPLLPGQAFQIRNTLANDPFLGFAYWRERPLEESES